MIIVSIILLAAFIGVSAINIGNVSADGEKAAVETVGSTTGEIAEGSELGSSIPTGSIVRMVSALVIVVFSIYICVFLLKKFMGRKYGGRHGKDNLLEVLESTYVGPKKMVSLVRVADKSVLIGVTDQNISVLTELDADQTSELVKAEIGQEEKANFSGFLQSASNRIKELGTRRNQAVLDN